MNSIEYVEDGNPSQSYVQHVVSTALAKEDEVSNSEMAKVFCTISVGEEWSIGDYKVNGEVWYSIEVLGFLSCVFLTVD